MGAPLIIHAFPCPARSGGARSFLAALKLALLFLFPKTRKGQPCANAPAPMRPSSCANPSSRRARGGRAGSGAWEAAGRPNSLKSAGGTSVPSRQRGPGKGQLPHTAGRWDGREIAMQQRRHRDGRSEKARHGGGWKLSVSHGRRANARAQRPSPTLPGGHHLGVARGGGS